MDVAQLRAQYRGLVDDVQHAMRAQLGDASRLSEQRDHILTFRMDLAASSVCLCDRIRIPRLLMNYTLPGDF
jgi:hypothetical protein